MKPFKKSMAVVLAFAALSFGVVQSVKAGDSIVTGTINLAADVELPNLPVIKMSADPKCEANNKGKEVKAPVLVLGPNKTVANVFVRVKSGLPTGKTYSTPAEPTVVDQFGCMYIPHVIGVMQNQKVVIKNSDGTLHNVHGQPKLNTEFNEAMPPFKKETTRVFDKVEAEPFKVKCDVHPWMSSFVAVMDNPFFSVTKEDGKFEIKNLEPGDYEIEIWHEKLGIQTAKVTVAAGETKIQDFSLTKPATVGLIDAVMVDRQN